MSAAFVPISPQQWRAQVESTLKGATLEDKLVARTLDGLDIAPLYFDQQQSSGDPGQPPFIRGATDSKLAPDRWKIGLRLNDTFSVAEQLLLEPEGIDAVVLGPRLPLRKRADLEPLAAFELHGEQSSIARALLLLASGLRVGSLGLDPLGAWVGGVPVAGGIHANLHAHGLLAGYAQTQQPGLPVFTVDGASYSEAGGSTPEILAAMLGAGITYLRVLASVGLGPDQAARCFVFRIPLDADQFLGIASLRAFRWLWGEVCRHSGVSAEHSGARIHASTAQRILTQRDPWVNLLRGTLTTFSGAVGGAELILTAPMDGALAGTNPLAARLARNTQLILAHEAHLGHVLDPAGGSFYVESLTRTLAEAAWQKLQALEQQGGLVPALQSGWLAQQLARTQAERATLVRKRKQPITGVSEFPLLDERGLESVASPPERHAPVELPELPPLDTSYSVAMNQLALAAGALAAGADVWGVEAALFPQPGESLPPLPSHRFAEPFERLRDRSDRHLAATGQRPRVFLANLGPIPEHLARATFAQNVLAAGGIEAKSNDGFATLAELAAAFEKSSATAAILCASDAWYAEQAVAAAQALRQAGAKRLLLAGRPGSQEADYRAAGVELFCFLGMDVVTFLEVLHDILEVTP